MLTADLVRVRKASGKLSVSSVLGKSKQRATELAQVYFQVASEMVGQTYGQLREAWEAVDVAPRDKKLALGLQKLIEDACVFETLAECDPRQLRSDVFLRASAARKQLGAQFDRQQVLSEVGVAVDLAPAVLEASLFADLRTEHRLMHAAKESAGDLLARYDFAQYQAVLLRAVQVTATVHCKSPAQYRALFRALKFRRLLHVIHPAENGYRIEIDGPFSLFESVTKYGLQLALMFPVLCQCDSLVLQAKIRWGKARTALGFEYTHSSKGAEPAALMSQDVETLVTAFEKLESAWSVQVNEELLDLPGFGVCIPDLVFMRAGKRVFVEVLGFWSRDAVWKRVELVEAGLPHPIVFAVSTKLRVSEAVLQDEQTAALYVYKGTMSPRALLAKVESLATQAANPESRRPKASSAKARATAPRAASERTKAQFKP